jgi:hypothetical protein
MALVPRFDPERHAGEFNLATLGGTDYADRVWPRQPSEADIALAATAAYADLIARTETAYQEALARQGEPDHGDAIEIVDLIVLRGGPKWHFTNQEEFARWYQAEFARGVSDRLTRLAAYREREHWRSAHYGRQVQRVTQEPHMVAVGTIDNLAYADKARWMLECVDCWGLGYANDDETGEITDGPFWTAVWAEPRDAAPEPSDAGSAG